MSGLSQVRGDNQVSPKPGLSVQPRMGGPEEPFSSSTTEAAAWSLDD